MSALNSPASALSLSATLPSGIGLCERSWLCGHICAEGHSEALKTCSGDPISDVLDMAYMHYYMDYPMSILPINIYLLLSV